MEHIEFVIYLLIFVAVIFLVLKYWKTGRRH